MAHRSPLEKNVRSLDLEDIWLTEELSECFMKGVNVSSHEFHKESLGLYSVLSITVFLLLENLDILFFHGLRF